MRRTYLDFEEPLRALDRARDAAVAQRDREAIEHIEAETAARATQICASLTPWQRVQLSRHIDRPFTLEYVSALVGDFVELHGDRVFGEDAAVVGGLGFRGERAVVVVGHQRGRGTAEKVRRNFGMPRPEGFRKAQRLFALAGRLGLPVLTFVDTQGAFPGTESEERGIAESISGCLATLAAIPVPVVCSVIGEGGSGGALAFAVGDALLMLEHSCLGVITPEGCASILERGRSPEAVARAAQSLKLTAPDLLRLGVADEIVPEPRGGAHRDGASAAAALGQAIDRTLASLERLSPRDLRVRRDARLRQLGRPVAALRG